MKEVLYEVRCLNQLKTVVRQDSCATRQVVRQDSCATRQLCDKTEVRGSCLQLI